MRGIGCDPPMKAQMQRLLCRKPFRKAGPQTRGRDRQGREL